MNIENAKSLNVNGGSKQEKDWTEECNTSVSNDFNQRDQVKGDLNCDNGNNSWGPEAPILNLNVNIPNSCFREKWQQNRVLRIIEKFHRMNLNYCHHHNPYWEPTKDSQKVPISSGEGGSVGTCSDAKTNGDPNLMRWKGIDCTHWISWVYNYGFNAHLVSLTGNQSCGPDAPGVVLPYTADDQDKFNPGDILFIAKNSSDKTWQISHGILWTGMKVKLSEVNDDDPFSKLNLLSNVPDSQKSAVANDLNDSIKNNSYVYIISDSHFAGPNYRAFAGWWKKAFAFARRLIEPDTNTFKTTHPTATFENQKCSLPKP
jgi:hypothetical protein